MRVESSTKVTNHRTPELVQIGDGPQTSERIKSKGIELLFEFYGKGTRWLFAKVQVLHFQSKFLLRSINKSGSTYFM